MQSHPQPSPVPVFGQKNALCFQTACLGQPGRLAPWGPSVVSLDILVVTPDPSGTAPGQIPDTRDAAKPPTADKTACGNIKS